MQRDTRAIRTKRSLEKTNVVSQVHPLLTGMYNIIPVEKPIEGTLLIYSLCKVEVIGTRTKNPHKA